jgi:hypothetical protein
MFVPISCPQLIVATFSKFLSWFKAARAAESKISVDAFAICYRYRFGIASDDALLTTQYAR